MSANCVRAALAAALLAVLAIVVAACDQAEGDDDPNSGLSNRELVKKAVANMVLLSSFHVEFSGMFEGKQASTVADVQLPGPGVWSAVPKGTPVPGSRYKFSNPGYVHQGTEFPATEREIIWASDNKYYQSEDAGQTWKVILWSYPEGGAASFLTGLSPWYDAASPDLVLEDGTPRLEEVNGIPARHMAADLTGLDGYYSWQMSGAAGISSETPQTLELWVSTDPTPAILKLVVKGEQVAAGATGQATAGSGERVPAASEPYTLTWQWSRLNEDLGEVKPPPTDTVR